MDHVITLTRQPSPCPSTSSGSSNDTVVTTPPDLSTSPTCIRYLAPELHWSTLVPGVPMKRPPARRKYASKVSERLLRLAARHTPREIAAIEQRRLEKEQLRKACIALVKQYSMLREVKRARRTKISPRTFETIQLCKAGARWLSIACNNAEYHRLSSKSQHETAKAKNFSGQIFIRDTLDAMRQALLEHGQYNTRRTDSSRHSFFVDAAVSRDDDLTGLAIVNKTRRPNWDSPWIVRGYRIEEALDQDTAETVAIWQALQIAFCEMLEAHASPITNPYGSVVIYSDSKTALQRIAGEKLGSTEIVREIYERSEEMKKMGVEVHLHWVPGHRNVHGNELADLVAKRARQPATKREATLTC